MADKPEMKEIDPFYWCNSKPAASHVPVVPGECSVLDAEHGRCEVLKSGQSVALGTVRLGGKATAISLDFMASAAEEPHRRSSRPKSKPKPKKKPQKSTERETKKRSGERNHDLKPHEKVYHKGKEYEVRRASKATPETKRLTENGEVTYHGKKGNLENPGKMTHNGKEYELHSTGRTEKQAGKWSKEKDTAERQKRHKDERKTNAEGHAKTDSERTVTSKERASATTGKDRAQRAKTSEQQTLAKHESTLKTQESALKKEKDPEKRKQLQSDIDETKGKISDSRTKIDKHEQAISKHQSTIDTHDRQLDEHSERTDHMTDRESDAHRSVDESRQAIKDANSQIKESNERLKDTSLTEEQRAEEHSKLEKASNTVTEENDNIKKSQRTIDDEQLGRQHDQENEDAERDGREEERWEQTAKGEPVKEEPNTVTPEAQESAQERSGGSGGSGEPGLPEPGQVGGGGGEGGGDDDGAGGGGGGMQGGGGGGGGGTPPATPPASPPQSPRGAGNPQTGGPTTPATEQTITKPFLTYDQLVKGGVTLIEKFITDNDGIGDAQRLRDLVMSRYTCTLKVNGHDHPLDEQFDSTTLQRDEDGYARLYAYFQHDQFVHGDIMLNPRRHNDTLRSDSDNGHQVELNIRGTKDGATEDVIDHVGMYLTAFHRSSLFKSKSPELQLFQAPSADKAVEFMHSHSDTIKPYTTFYIVAEAPAGEYAPQTVQSVLLIRH